MLEFHTAVEEIFDVQLLTGVRFPELMGFQKDAIHHAFVVPPEARPPSASPPAEDHRASARRPPVPVLDQV
jgi:hypothetical protein